jgi:hypothetical protein
VSGPDQDPSVILHKLAAPFTAEAVDWRVGATSPDKTSGLALAYVDARTVADRLDAVCGPFWRCTYPTILRSGADGKTSSIVVCQIEVKLSGEWIARCNGAGDTAVEAEKGALSDAFKRAATMWGIGRYLYAFPSPWVLIEPHGRSFSIARGEWPKLHKLAADALAKYKADPAAFRAAAPEPPPERPAFTPTPTPARPATTTSPAPRSTSGTPADALAAELRAATNLDAVADVVRRARAGLAGDDLASLDKLFADRTISSIDRCGTAKDAAGIEVITRFLNTKGLGPAKRDAPRIRAALEKARRAATMS